MYDAEDPLDIRPHNLGRWNQCLTVVIKGSFMWDKLDKTAGKAKDTITSTKLFVGDLNRDGKIDQEDIKIATEHAKKAASTVRDETVKLGKHTLRSDMFKDAVVGAVVGAIIGAVIFHFISFRFVDWSTGALLGAVLVAGASVYKSLTNRSVASSRSKDNSEICRDIYAELLKLDDLKKKGILSDTEFETQRKKLLGEY